MKQAIYSVTSDVEGRLEELGLSTEVLHGAIKFGQVHRDECTENDPSAFPGMVAWARTIRGLRELLVLQGWVRFDDQKIPLVLNPSGTVAITVATGNIDTGNAGINSKTKYPKGPATAAVVEQNAVQLSFFYLEEKVKPIRQKISNCLTWVLLISRNGDEIRSELSLPHEIAEDGRVANWVERIILPPIYLGTAPESSRYEEEGADDIVVEISRRDAQP